LEEVENMLARGLRRHVWSASLLVGLGVITASCGASAPARGLTPPTLTPAPSPTATIAPTPTATTVAIAGCGDPYPEYESPPGPLPTAIPLSPGTLVATLAQGIQAGSALYHFCTPGTTPAAITAYMVSALPAAGWKRNSVPACTHTQGYPWYKGPYGVDMTDLGAPSASGAWALDICPHVGQ
jgi:hypothetical protein